MALSSTQGERETKKVIFVCEHGAGKSVVAAVYFNKIAKERELDWQASCRGTNPDKEVSQATKEGLKSDGLLDPNLVPEKLSVSDTDNVERIIAFTKMPDHSNPRVMTLDWSTLPSIDANYEARKEALIKKINEFFDSVEKETPSPFH